MNGSKYERELKQILRGDKEKIDDVTNSCRDNIRNSYYTFKYNPFLVVRGAGSLGVDLIAIRGEFSLLLEIKSSKQSTINLSGKRLKEQKRDIISLAIETDVVPLYCFRMKNKRGERWSIFTIGIQNQLNTKNKKIMNHIPTLISTGKNSKMVWERGKKLNEFADLYETEVLKDGL